MFVAGIAAVVGVLFLIVSWLFVGFGGRDEMPEPIIMGVVIGILGVVLLIAVTHYMTAGGWS